ncbi:MAG: hypothetical protein U0T84_07590 [Chitinophagales bacterium]
MKPLLRFSLYAFTAGSLLLLGGCFGIGLRAPVLVIEPRVICRGGTVTAKVQFINLNNRTTLASDQSRSADFLVYTAPEISGTPITVPPSSRSGVASLQPDQDVSVTAIYGAGTRFPITFTQQVRVLDGDEMRTLAFEYNCEAQAYYPAHIASEELGSNIYIQRIVNANDRPVTITISGVSEALAPGAASTTIHASAANTYNIQAAFNTNENCQGGTTNPGGVVYPPVLRLQVTYGCSPDGNP